MAVGVVFFCCFVSGACLQAFGAHSEYPGVKDLGSWASCWQELGSDHIHGSGYRNSDLRKK